MKKYWLSLVIYFCLCLSNVNSTIIKVPEDYSTIQAGIVAAIFGDTVLVSAGRYEVLSPLAMKSGVVLLGRKQSEVIIDANGNDRAIVFENCEAGTEISNFTIMGGNAPSGSGGGILISNSSIKISNTFSMLVLVLADNLVLMFVGWEGVASAPTC